jgi:hypothetical protein
MTLFHKSRCYNGGSCHHFEPRYTEIGKPISGLEPLWIQSLLYAFGIEKARDLFVTQQYCSDVCVWCGKVTNKRSES